jgi:hypothetical protein
MSTSIHYVNSRKDGEAWTLHVITREIVKSSHHAHARSLLTLTQPLAFLTLKHHPHSADSAHSSRLTSHHQSPSITDHERSPITYGIIHLTSPSKKRAWSNLA